jgi:hypothetical protein
LFDYRLPTVVRLQDINLSVVNDDEVTIGILVLKLHSQSFQFFSYNMFVSFQTIINHPDYRANRKYNDIALLRLESDVTLTINLFPACLWTGSNDRVIRNVTAIGFGVTNTQSMKGKTLIAGVFFLLLNLFFLQ